MDDPQSNISIFHSIWSAAITVAGAIVAFFTKRIVEQLDAKADQCDLEELKSDLTKTMDALFRRQDEQHKQNTDRLDRIIMELNRK